MNTYSDRNFLRIYTNLVVNAAAIGKAKTKMQFDQLRGHTWDLLCQLEREYPAVYDNLQANPIHFRPRELELRVWNERFKGN